MGQGIASRVEPAPEEARHSIAYREEVLRWDVEAITAAHNRLLQRRPALVDILGGCGLSRHFKEAAPPGGDEGSGSRRTGFAALSQIRRGYTVNRREFWEIFTDYNIINPDDHAFLSLPMSFFNVFASSSQPNAIPALQVFSILILLCKSPQHDQVGALFDLFCWGQSDLEQAELTALVGTVSTGFAKFGVTNAPLSAAGVKAVAASVFERADVNNSEHVCKSEFHRWAQIHAGSEDFLGLVAKYHDDVAHESELMHQLADDVDSRVRRASVCSVVSITGALQLNLSHAAGQHADEAGTASNRRGSVTSGRRGSAQGGGGRRGSTRAPAAATEGGEAGEPALASQRSSRRKGSTSTGRTTGTANGTVTARGGSTTKARRHTRKGARRASQRKAKAAAGADGGDASEGGGEGGGAGSGAGGGSAPRRPRKASLSEVMGTAQPSLRRIKGAGDRRVGHGGTEVTGLMLNTMDDFVRVKQMMERTRDMKLRVVANRRVMMELANSGVKFTRKELLKLAQQFTDESSSRGHIDKEALRALLESHLPNMAAADEGLMHRIFLTLDIDRNGKLDFKEFALGMNSFLKGDLNDKVKFTFRMHDLDGDGHMSVAELVHFIRHTHQDLQDTIDFAEEVMQSLDVSGDGLMSREEFQAALDTEPGLMETMTALLAVDVTRSRPIHQMRAAAPEQLTADRLLQLLQRGAHRLNSGHRQMSVEQLTGFLVGHFNLNSEDSELLHRVAMVHGAFDPAHTGTVSLQRVLLGMGQCFCPSVTMQAEVFFELFDMSGDGQLDNSEILHMVLESRAEVKKSARLVLKTLNFIDKDGDGVVTCAEFCGRATRDRTLMAALHRLFEPVGPSHLRRPSHKHRKGTKRRRNRGERDRGSRRNSSHQLEEGSRRPSNEAHPSPGEAPPPATALGEAAEATAASGSGVTGVQEWGAEPGVFAAGGAGADATPPKPTAAPTNTPTASKPASPSGSHRPHAAHASSTPSRRHGGAHPATPAGAAAQLQEGVSGASPTHTPAAPQRDGSSARRHSRHRGRAHRSRHNRIVDGDSHLDLLTRGDTGSSLLAEPAESPQRTMESPPHRPRHRHQGAAGATNGGTGHVVDDTPFATGVTPPSSLAALRAGARAEMGSADLEARFQRHDSGSMRGMLTPTSPATGGVGGGGSSSNGRRGQHPRSRHHRQARKHSQRLLQHSPVRVPAARGNHSTHQASPARPTPSKVKLTALPGPTQPLQGKASLPPTMLDSSEVRPASPV